MDAYNRHNISALMALYAENISVYIYPDIALAIERPHLESIFVACVCGRAVGVKTHSHIENGSYVINKEVVNYAGSDKKHVSRYKLEKGLLLLFALPRSESADNFRVRIFAAR